MIDVSNRPWHELQGEVVVLDIDAPYVYLGTLVSVEEHHLVLQAADAHDLRDTATTREKYILDCREHGLRPNRVQVYIDMRRVVSISRLEDVIV